jgi:hypothetical protein
MLPFFFSFFLFFPLFGVNSMTRDSDAMILFLIIFIFLLTFYIQRNLLLESTTKWLLEMESSLVLVLSWNMHHIHVR